jgi:phage protein D
MVAERKLSDRSVSIARPTIRVDGREHERTTELLLAMNLVEQEGGMSALELRFSNWASSASGAAELAFEDEELLRFGATIAIYGGDEGTPRELFRGKITSFELELSQDAPPELVVFAEDALQRARMARKTQLHEDVSVADVAGTVARNAQLRPVVTGFSDNIGPQWQQNESDLAFLRRLLARYDGDLQVVGEELQVSPRSEVRRDELTLQMFSQLTRARITADLAHQASEVTVSGWDPERASKISVSSRGNALGPGAGRRGSALLEEAIGQRAEHIGHVPVLSESEARLIADASYDQRARRFVILEGTTDGNASLRVGTSVRIEGASSRFDNTFYVTKACHRYDQKRGYLTDFTAECAYLGGP